MTEKEVLNFARSKGYAGISEKTLWNGYDVYKLDFNLPKTGGVFFVGPPVYVLVKGEQIRFASPKESSDFQGFKYSDGEELSEADLSKLDFLAD